jgi:hypothetical protein
MKQRSFHRVWEFLGQWVFMGARDYLTSTAREIEAGIVTTGPVYDQTLFLD